MTSQTCNTCHQSKPLADYYRAQGMRLGVTKRCKKCTDLKSREWQRANKARVAELTKSWSERNRDYHYDLIAKWHSERPGYHREKYKKNPARVLLRNKLRASLEARAIPKWVDLELVEAMYKRAAELTEATGVPHQVDHVIPIKSKLVCGLHWHTNLQVLTRGENCSKGNRWWPDMPT